MPLKRASSRLRERRRRRLPAGDLDLAVGVDAAVDDAGDDADDDGDVNGPAVRDNDARRPRGLVARPASGGDNAAVNAADSGAVDDSRDADDFTLASRASAVAII